MKPTFAPFLICYMYIIYMHVHNIYTHIHGESMRTQVKIQNVALNKLSQKKKPTVWNINGFSKINLPPSFQERERESPWGNKLANCVSVGFSGC